MSGTQPGTSGFLKEDHQVSTDQLTSDEFVCLRTWNYSIQIPHGFCLNSVKSTEFLSSLFLNVCAGHGRAVHPVLTTAASGGNTTSSVSCAM